jgi:glutathione S-transferase
MPFEFAELEEATKRDGLRMVVVPGIPSPWGEAVKGILHIKQLPGVAIRLDVGNPAMMEWTGGHSSAPVVVHGDEQPRSGWAEILLLAERLAPEPGLLPVDAGDRALALGLAHEICGEMGLGWCRRNACADVGLKGEGGFPKPIAGYLAAKYGYRAEEADLYGRRVIEILGALAARLRAQRDSGSRFYIGESLSAVDVYSATFMALFKPLPPEQCPMPDFLRAAFEALDPETAAALDPILTEHRDFVYAEYLELPMRL